MLINELQLKSSSCKFLKFVKTIWRFDGKMFKTENQYLKKNEHSFKTQIKDAH